MQKWIGVVLLFVGISGAHAQSNTHSFSLKEAQEYAIANSYSNRIADADLEIAKRQVKQITAIGLPQINATSQYQNFLTVPKSAIPANTFNPFAPEGSILEAALGQAQTFSVGVTASQLIFDGGYIVGLQAAKAFAEFSELQKDQSKSAIMSAVAETYYLAVLANENVSVLDESKQLLEKTLSDTKALFDNGFVEQQDVDQLTLSVSDLQNQMRYASQQSAIALDLLKFQVGLKETETITLKDTKETLISLEYQTGLLNESFDSQINRDYKLALSGVGLQELSVRKEKTTYLPSLGAFYNLSTQAQRSEFNFTETEGSQGKWYPTQLVGVTLNVPILSSGQRHQTLQIAKLELEKSQIQLEQVVQATALEYKTSKNEYSFALENYNLQVENIALAKSIFEKTQIKYTEGVASSFEIATAQQQLLARQGEYIGSIQQLLSAQNRLEKALSKY